MKKYIYTYQTHAEIIKSQTELNPQVLLQFYELISTSINEHKDDFVKIHISKFKRIHTQQSKFINFLKENKIIETWKSFNNKETYVVGEQSKSYKILIPQEKSLKLVEYNTKSLDKFLAKYKAYQKEKYKISLGLNDNYLKANKLHTRELINFYKKVVKEIPKSNFDEAIKWSKINLDGSKLLFNLNNLLRIQYKILFVSRNTTNYRLDTNFTNLKTELRKILLKDKYEIDISNSQPMILANKLQNEINNNELNSTDDIINFIKTSANGTLYEFMAEKLNITRKEAKNSMFPVLFGKKRNKSDGSKIFRTIFPTVNKYINTLKDNNYKDVSQVLQRFESNLILDKVAPKLIEMGIKDFVTVHDSIIFKSKQEAELGIRLIKGELIINPNITIKKL